MEKKEIKVSINVKENDMFWFMMQHTYRSLGGVVSLLFSLASFALLLYTWNTVDIQYKVILAICSLLFTVVNPLMLYTRSRKQVAVKPGFQSAIEYVFTEKGFTMRQGEETAAASWGDLWKIRDSKRYFILYGNRVRANIIPKSQMGGQAEYVSQLIKEYRKKA